MAIHNLLADSLARIRNAQMALHLECTLGYSKFVLSVMKLLKAQGYIKDVVVINRDNGEIVENLEDNKVIKRILVTLKYYTPVNQRSTTVLGVIRQMKLISTCSRRIYTKIGKLKPFKNGLGSYILSTPKGIMTDAQAVQHNLGGELLFVIF